MGAPNYSPVQNPEAGRVYVYRNNAVSTQEEWLYFGVQNEKQFYFLLPVC